ncbi:MAG: GntR family transcriptional regulator [Bryobacteraceae bacterium]|nr:GntR family transcriptional regulator [Bryobacteraceae bacterium]
MNRGKTFQFRLHPESGVPVYRQLIDQVTSAIASGLLSAGMQLPTVRQVAVDLTINPNTVMRAYREMEIRGVLETQQGSGTYVADRKVTEDEAARDERLSRLAAQCAARAGAEGFTVEQLVRRLNEMGGQPAGRSSSRGR